MMSLRMFFALILLAGSGFVHAQGFKISGTDLLDANNNKFIMKGFSVPTAWFVNDCNGNITNMKNKTNANCMRIVVTTSLADNAWQTTVNNCISNKIVPMVELHDVTGLTDANRLNDMAKFWVNKKSFLTSSNVGKYILINIANEWGDWAMANSGQDKWRDAYKTAITTIRNAGIKTTLVVDGCDWGQDLKNASTIMKYAEELQDFDPEKNLLFSVHMYCEWAKNGGSNAAIALPALKAAGIPVIVGEFGYQHDNGNGGVCDIDEAAIISTCQDNGIGWLAWSWKGNGGNVTYLDLSSDWAGNSLSTWGNTVVNGANGTKTAATAGVFLGIIAKTEPIKTTVAFAKDMHIAVLPQGVLSISIPKSNAVGTIQVFDIAGNLIAKKEVANSNQAHIIRVGISGVYFVNAMVGTTAIVKKVVVK